MNNKRYMIGLTVGTITTVLTAGALAPVIIEKLNEDETSKFKRIKNAVGVFAGCFLAGYMVGTIIRVEENQIRFVESVTKAVKKIEA
jgi:predicted small secreted protein